MGIGCESGLRWGARPAAWVAQDVIRLSTHPTFSGEKLEPRAVDLRAFVIQSRRGTGADVRVLPAALSRVAPAGSLIVNSSRGGGAKDTWVLRAPGADGPVGHRPGRVPAHRHRDAS